MDWLSDIRAARVRESAAPPSNKSWLTRIPAFQFNSSAEINPELTSKPFSSLAW